MQLHHVSISETLRFIFPCFFYTVTIVLSCSTIENNVTVTLFLFFFYSPSLIPLLS